MQATKIIFIIIAFLISILIAYFQYYYKIKNKPKLHILLFILKTLSLFLLLLLLINPTIHKTEITNEKPVLSVLVDNSKSVQYFKEANNVKSIVNQLKNNKELQNKFDVQYYSFGNDLQVLDSLYFTKNNTNINKAVSSINELNKNKISPILLISDGNQTIGSSYEFLNLKQPVYPLVVGDTVKYKDVKIAQLNVNKYSYIKNKFPVEVILNYEGNVPVNTQFSISSNEKVIFRKNVSFSSDEKSTTITTNLTSTKEGLQYYTASINKLDKEKNTKNNSKNFSVEVINQQTKVLLLTSIMHPDIGALKKAIESNKQRSVEISLIDNFKGNIEDFQLVILNQVNSQFKSVIAKIKSNNSNYFIISGLNSNWNFINNQQLGFLKNAINQSESYSAIFNDAFLTFLQEDIGFNNFPPLNDKFGETTFAKEHQTLLYQNINGLQTNYPLLATFDVNNQKSAVLFGEGIWKWRAASFLNTNSFKEFDTFIGSLIQFLASNKKRTRLEVNAKNIYPANSTITISAFFTDKNYKFDDRASLEITITNKESKEIKKIPFSLVNNAYQVEIEDLNSGDYSYKIEVLGQKVQKYGSFKITDYQIEEQFTNADVLRLNLLSNNTNGKLFYKNEFDKLTKALLENDSFYTIQKSSLKKRNLIDWKWILFLAITLFTIEWFLRKYYGKI